MAPRRALLTGGTGFIGGHIARALVAEGTAVRCLVRPSSRLDNLAALDVELVEGDLGDFDSLTRAVSGCDAVFHCAADYRLWAKDPAEIYRANVEGTRAVLQSAAEGGVDRVVYTSSVAAIGSSADGSPADERTPATLDAMIGHYKRSKFLAERVAREWAEAGLPVVIVNPSTPVGELDVKPTPTGQMIVDFVSGRMRAFVESGLNLIDVRDVARGHLLAAEKGKVGQRYILGHRNLTLKQVFDALSNVSGIPSPRVRIPHAAALGYAALESLWAKGRGRPPRAPVEAVRMSRHRMFFDSSRAVRELGLPQSPVDDALRRAVEWFRAKGYAPS